MSLWKVWTDNETNRLDGSSNSEEQTDWTNLTVNKLKKNKNATFNIPYTLIEDLLYSYNLNFIKIKKKTSSYVTILRDSSVCHLHVI